jgi:phosphoribosylformylglycinamidine synthase subunit PurQ / glutaminase
MIASCSKCANAQRTASSTKVRILRFEGAADFARDGGPVLGICNGFQILCEAGLLPGALLRNERLRFVCRPVPVIIQNAQTAWTSAYAAGQTIVIPVKNGEGRYYADQATLDELEAQGRVVARYARGHNPNGALRDIAGVTNGAKNVFGLMPHPEHAVDPLTGSADGGRLFQSLVADFEELVAA